MTEPTASSSIAADPRRSSLTDEEVVALSDGHQHCLVCYGDLTHRGKLPCGHDDICGVCHLRLRFLHDDRRCPICKQQSDGAAIVVDEDPARTFADYPRWGDDIGAGFVYREDVGMFFRGAYYEQTVAPLFAFACHRCDFRADEAAATAAPGAGNRRTTPQRLLEDHLRTAHRLSLCHLCIDHKRDFVSRLPRMTPSQFQTHLKKGDGPASGFHGHPACEFCRPKRFYDLNYLHQHLHKEHYKCHVCERKGADNQWFKNYGSLERHFDRAHFMCHDVQCLAARFVVFDNELDLRAHEMSVHGGTSTGSTKINLEFQTRRRGYDGSGVADDNPRGAPAASDFNYDLDGQAFVPEALPTQGGNHATIGNSSSGGNNNQRTGGPAPTFSAGGGDAPLHPLHVQRTEEMRAHAAVVRQQQARQSQADSFPTLQSASAAAAVPSSSAPLVAGWTSGTSLQRVHRGDPRIVGRVTQEAFPALTSAPAGGNHSRTKAPTAPGGTTRRQFAAMTATASQPQGAGGQPLWGGGGGGGGGGTVTASAAVVLTPLTSSSAAARSSSNQQSNLAADNFPALRPSSVPSRPSPFAASNAAAKKNSRGGGPLNVGVPPSFSSVADFPTFGGNGNGAAAAAAGVVVAAAKAKAQQQQRPPSLDSSSDFPPPPSANPPFRATSRQQVLRGGPAAPVAGRADLPSSATAAARATVEDIKASLGPARFKQLKRLTRDFAQGELSPEGYVDQSAALFDGGYGDDDFWSSLPSLLESCPNEEASMRALRYMTSLRRQKFSDDARPAMPATSVGAPAPAASQWGGSAPHSVTRQPPAAAVAAPPAPAGYSVAARPLTQLGPATLGQSHAVASKKKSAWGSGGNATVVRVKAPPGGTVGVAAAQEGPQGGTATKFMAQEQKRQSHANNLQQKQSNGKKKKEKDELKALAFGR